MPQKNASDDFALTLGAGKQQAVRAPPASRQHKVVVRLLAPEERPYYVIEGERDAYICAVCSGFPLACSQCSWSMHLMCAALTQPAAPAVICDRSNGPQLSQLLSMRRHHAKGIRISQDGTAASCRLRRISSDCWRCRDGAILHVAAAPLVAAAESSRRGQQVCIMDSMQT
jgi:hypothetical protein